MKNYVSFIMNLKKTIIVIVAVVGLTGIRLATLIDDPQHLITPDPDCPICQAYQSQVLLITESNLTTPSTLQVYLNEQSPVNPNSDIFHPILSIRAPPFS
jgi:hypothetical protein